MHILLTVGKHSGHTEQAMRGGVWRLIDRGRIKFVEGRLRLEVCDAWK